MSTGAVNKTARSLTQKVFIGLFVITFLVMAGYWANKTVQSYLGQSAIDATGLQVLSLKDALQQAKNTDQLILADMSAIWCPTCRRLDTEIFSNDSVKTELNQNYIFARIEYDSVEGEAFRQTYDVVGFPTLLVLNHRAEKLIQLPIEFEPASFVKNLQKVTQAVNL